MNYLVIGNPHSFADERLVYLALKELKLNATYQVCDSVDPKAISTADLILIFNSIWYKENLLPQINKYRKKTCKTVFWSFDFCSEGARFARTKKIFPYIDLLVTTDNSIAWETLFPNYLWLNQGIYPPLYAKSVERNLKYDIIFMGNLETSGRLEKLQQLSDRFNVAYCGHSPLANKTISHLGPIPREKVQEICNQSKLVFVPEYRDGIKNYWSNRIYLMMASGTPCLIETVSGMEKEFTTNLGYFCGDWKSVINNATLAVTNLETSFKIGEAGRDYVLSRYKYIDRVRILLKHT